MRVAEKASGFRHTSYKRSTIVNYDSRVVVTRKLLILRLAKISYRLDTFINPQRKNISVKK